MWLKTKSKDCLQQMNVRTIARHWKRFIYKTTGILSSQTHFLFQLDHSYDTIFLFHYSLEEIMPEIFRLPSLVTLDISNNKLQRIPFDMWKAPKLRELNIAFNLLKDLPTSEDVSLQLMKNCLM